MMVLPEMGGKGRSDMSWISRNKAQAYFLMTTGLVVGILAFIGFLIWAGIRCRRFLKKRKERRRVVPMTTAGTQVSASPSHHWDKSESDRNEYVAIWMEEVVASPTNESWTSAVSSEEEEGNVHWTSADVTPSMAISQVAIFNEFMEEQTQLMGQRPAHTIINMDLDEEEIERPGSAVVSENRLDDDSENMEQRFYQLAESMSSMPGIDAGLDDELPAGIENAVPMDRRMNQWATVVLVEEIDDTEELIASQSLMKHVEEENEEPLETEYEGLEIPLAAPIRWNMEEDECSSEYEMSQVEKQEGHIAISVDLNNQEIFQEDPITMGIQEEQEDYNYNDNRTQEEVPNMEDYYSDCEMSHEHDAEERQEIVATVSWSMENYDAANAYERKVECRADEDKNQDGNIALVLDMNNDAILQEELMRLDSMENQEQKDSADDYNLRIEEETRNIREYYYDYESPEDEDLEEYDPKIQHSIMESFGASGSSSAKSIPITETGDQVTKNNPASVNNNTFPAFDRNRNDDTTLAYVLTSDDEDQLDLPLDSTNPELFDNIQSPDAISVESDEISERRVSAPVQQDRLTGRHLLEGEPVDPGETNANASDVAASAWQRALNMDSNLLDYAQAEGGWIRKRVDHYHPGPSHETELPNTVDVLGFGPGILTTILEPVNRFVTSLISPGGSQMLLIEPDQAPMLEVEDYNDQDQDSIRAEMTRLTRPRKPPGLISYLDFCQAEGSPHPPPQNNNQIPATFSLRHPATLNSSGWMDDTEAQPPLPTDEELEKEEQEEYAAKLSYQFGVAESGTTDDEAESEENPAESDQVLEAEPEDENEITTENPSDVDAVTIQADMSSSPTTSPRNVRQTITAGGIPLELNINLTLQSCCHHASGTKGCCRCNETMPSTRDKSPPGRKSLDPTESRGFEPSTAELPFGTPTETCPCAGAARDVIMCGTDNPEQRVYGLTSILDFMQAEGSPCYAQEDGGGGLDIESHITSWWETAAQAITPQAENDEEDSATEGGLITIKRPKRKMEENGAEKRGSESEAPDPEAEQVIRSEIESTVGTSETVGEDVTTDKDKSSGSGPKLPPRGRIWQ